MTPRFGWLALVGGAALVIGCNGDESEASNEANCAPGEWLRNDGVCAPAGLPPDTPCAPGECLRQEDGACIPAGVPADGCGEGFVHDRERGCAPILPAAPCPDGLMAVPGETRCREVAPCAPGSFGGIPVEPDTEYVDASYVGGASDGSPAAPWTSIQQAIDAAPAGAIVAVAAGSYLEDVDIQGKPVRLWGTCPTRVELVGSAGALAALVIREGASGSEVHRMAVTGQAFGVALSGSENVLVEEVWIHDNADRGVDAEAVLGATSLFVNGALIERNREVGMFVAGSSATLQRAVVRDTALDAQGRAGRGIVIQNDTVTGARANMRVTSSLIERNHGVGAYFSGSDATVEHAVVRDTLPDAQGLSRGMGIEDDPTTGARASVQVKSSLFERNQVLGMFVGGSDATLDRVVVRDTVPNAQGLGGRGISIQDHAATGARANVVVTRSLVERNHVLGVFVSGSDATVECTAVRNTYPDAQGLFGRGIGIQDAIARASVVVTSSLVEHSEDVGVFVGGSDVTVERTVVRDTLPDAQGFGGRAVQVQAHDAGAAASATLRASLFERSVEAGVAVAGHASAELEACLVRDTVPNQLGGLGDGLVVGSYNGPASATVIGMRIEQSGRAAISSFGGAVALGSSLLVCQGFDIAAEPWQGQPAMFDDLGGVFCGCPEATERCIAESYALEAPPPVAGAE